MRQLTCLGSYLRRWYLPPILLVTLIGLVFLSVDLRFFQQIQEVFLIVIAGTAIIVADHARAHDWKLARYLSITTGWSIALLLLHALAALEPVVQGEERSLAIYLWVAATVLQSLAFATAPYHLTCEPDRQRLHLRFGLLCVLLLLVTLSDLLPSAYDEAGNLTVSLRYIEFMAAGLLGVALIHFWRQRAALSKDALYGMTAALLTLICAEVVFTQAGEASVAAMTSCHLLKLFGYWLVYMAVAQHSSDEDGAVCPARQGISSRPESDRVAGGRLPEACGSARLSVETEYAALRDTLKSLCKMVDLRDPYTAGHERRVGLIAKAIGQELGWSNARCELLELAGLVHDIGKIAIPNEILTKPTRLTALEMGLMRGHVEAGYEILKDLPFPTALADIVRQHHERLDGSGYPQGLRGSEILPEARVLMVADVVESISAHRPYRAAMGVEAALAELGAGRGRLYDADMVDAVNRLLCDKSYQLPE